MEALDLSSLLFLSTCEPWQLRGSRLFSSNLDFVKLEPGQEDGAENEGAGGPVVGC